MNPLNNLYKVITELNEINKDECRAVMTDYDSYLDTVQNKIYDQTFRAQYSNAEKFYKKGNKSGEKRSLIFAINVSESIKSMNKYLSNEHIRDYVTGRILTSGKIAQRLDSLGGIRLR
ncbi:MAG: hypothetical protein R6V22_12115 [Rhodohalobacter sp.]|uniref:hypothetical protein n=1 Tax=Rhodohalobacter sp. TaxID=1974210 RepID=UPI00397609F9